MWRKGKFLLKCMIIFFVILESKEGAKLLNACDKYDEKFCQCSHVDRAEKTMRMCSYKAGEDESCKPCQDVSQEMSICAECPELACPACNTTSDGSPYDQTMLSFVKDQDDFRNDNRVKRRASQKWCRIENELKSGRLTCKAWHDKKECTMKCSKADTYMNGYMYKFQCSRKENIWRMDIQSCTSGQEKEMKDNDCELPLSKIIAGPRSDFKVFLPLRNVQVQEGNNYETNNDYDGSGRSGRHIRSHHSNQPITVDRAIQKSDAERLPPMMLPSNHFKFDGKLAFDADGKMPLEYIIDQESPEPEGIWMMLNESSFSYAPYDDNPKVPPKRKPRKMPFESINGEELPKPERIFMIQNQISFSFAPHNDDPKVPLKTNNSRKFPLKKDN